MPKIKLANDRVFNAEPGQVLLGCAQSHGLLLEHSCRTGRCGVCKAQVLEGRTKIEILEEALTPGEVEAGYILTCCRSAADDLKLGVEDLGTLANLKAMTLPCRVDSLVKLSADVLQVTLRTPPSSHLAFVAGQHVSMIGKDGIRRSYSIAHRPRKDGKLKLHIRRVLSGVMSQYWFEAARVDDLLRLEGPLGTFCMRENRSSNVVFLATGTGIAPVKAMLEELDVSSHRDSYQKVRIYWGGRVPADMYWSPEFENLSFDFIPVLSRADGKWLGRRGYVQNALLDDNLALGDSSVYACGSNNMIRSAREQLIQAGLPAKNFYSDAFVSSD